MSAETSVTLPLRSPPKVSTVLTTMTAAIANRITATAR